MRFVCKLIFVSLALFFSQSEVSAQSTGHSYLDQIEFGNTISENTHQFTDGGSRIVHGGLNEPARILLAPVTPSWSGGKMSFVIKVDPDKQNYITTRFWGNDVNHNLLYFVCGDKMIGSRHLGDVDLLDLGSDFPFYNDRFFYKTSPLPLSLTKGKTELRFEIRSQGPIWGYGTNWEQYQKDMKEVTRGIYKVYTHTDGCFYPAQEEKQGIPPAEVKRKGPGAEVLERVKSRVNDEINKLRKSTSPLNQMQMQFLAKAYWIKWTYAYKDKEVLYQVLNALDELYVAFKSNPNLAYNDRATPNPDWFGFGPSACAVNLLYDEIKKKMDDKIDDGFGHKVSRREALTDMFLTSRKMNQKTRRQYTNQTMIKDLYGIYYCNKGLQVLGSDSAFTEPEALRYLYEAVGLQPWLGSDGVDGKPTFSQGKNYWQLTEKGLTKELGFVGNYGEVIDWCVEIYDATRPKPGMPGDEKIKNQIDRIALARSYFRYPMPDDDKFKAMRQEVVVGWRDTHYPGDVTYAQRPSWDGGPLQIVAATLNPKLIGFAQQMLNDNQFFYTLEQRMKDNGFRVTHGLLPVPEQYEIVKAQKPSGYKLPMTWDQSDFVFSDEEDGVIAIKNGQEIVYASLYWRARNAVNNLGRVHAITPNYDRVSTVYIEEKFDSSGLFYSVPDYTNMAFGNGGLKYPDSLHLAHAGEKLAIAKMPSGITYKTGQEHPLAGRANFYKMQFGHYIIAMNASKDKTFALTVPDDFAGAVNLVTGEKVNKKTITVSATSTVVLYKNNNQ